MEQEITLGYGGDHQDAAFLLATAALIVANIGALLPSGRSIGRVRVATCYAACAVTRGGHDGTRRAGYSTCYDDFHCASGTPEHNLLPRMGWHVYR